MVRKFYHVDALNKLKIGDSIFSSESVELKNLRTYELSSHGCRYLIGGSTDSFYELLYEIIRINNFPDKTSRLESLFAFKTIEEARGFASKYRSSYPYRILELEAENYELLDMNWLSANSGIDIYNNCLEYWSGNKTENPSIECLLKLPVKVVGVIE